MDDTENTTPTTETPTEQSTDDLIRQLLKEQQEHRAEVAEMRKEINAQKVPAPAPSSTVQSPDELMAARLAEVAQHSHYCPGCGRLFDYQQKCQGRPEAPHPAIEVVSTDELKSGDETQHTAPVYVLP